MIEFDTKLSTVPETYANDRVHFFKYMSASTAKIVLKNRTLRWGTTAALNDPFEMIFDATIKADRAEIKAAALEQLWSLYSGAEPIKAANAVGVMFEYIRVSVPDMTKDQIFEEFGPAIDEGMAIIESKADANVAQIMPVFSDIKILSLSQRPDIGLLWSHYTDAHKGVVLRLRSIPAFDSPYGMARPVTYAKEVPELFTASYLVNSFCGIETVSVRDITDRIIFRKSPQWAYEEEWRISAGTGRNPTEPFEDCPFGLHELDGIIFGMKTTDADKSEIRALAAAYPNVEFMQASAIPNTDQLDINVIA